MDEKKQPAYELDVERFGETDVTSVLEWWPPFMPGLTDTVKSISYIRSSTRWQDVDFYLIDLGSDECQLWLDEIKNSTKTPAEQLVLDTIEWCQRNDVTDITAWLERKVR